MMHSRDERKFYTDDVNSCRLSTEDDWRNIGIILIDLTCFYWLAGLVSPLPVLASRACLDVRVRHVKTAR